MGGQQQPALPPVPSSPLTRAVHFQSLVLDKGACEKPKFLENIPHASGELEVKLWTVRYPKSHNHSAQATGTLQFPSEAQKQATQTSLLPQEQPQPIQPDSSPEPQTPGSSPRKFTQPQRHKCTSNPEPAAQAGVLRGHPAETLPSWGLISTENTAIWAKIGEREREREMEMRAGDL